MNEIAAINAHSLNQFLKQGESKLTFKKPTAALIKSGAAAINYSKYTLRKINSVLAKTDFIIIDPDSAPMDQVTEMSRLAFGRKFIPLLSANNCDQHNYKSLSFGIFEGSNSSQAQDLFIFAYLSNEVDQLDIEDELDGVAVDTLNDMFAIYGGANYSIFLTILNKQKAISK